ncbi:hypothetical protein [Zooshikella harenae]|uniref:Uncharacterized protein n=1 Tax=Zooshikella harenae TaxID=2827238 RepID=A0ABS5ZKD8_9GAMM|nr:hypothetical protein [Zooshikella harenae]MBU2714544.1 hypothetical protein [Zooshikella harenae]
MSTSSFLGPWMPSPCQQHGGGFSMNISTKSQAPSIVIVEIKTTSASGTGTKTMQFIGPGTYKAAYGPGVGTCYYVRAKSTSTGQVLFIQFSGA